MKPKRLTVFEWFLVVEGSGSFPLDMLRYDSAFPYREEDTRTIEREHEKRRVVVCRRGVNVTEGNAARWRSFGWTVILATDDHGQAVDLTRS